MSILFELVACLLSFIFWFYRAEKNVSILSKDIKDMQASKLQVAEEKLQSVQTENTSLKSALSKATNE